MQLNETTLSVVPEACTIADACTVPQSVNAGCVVVSYTTDEMCEVNVRRIGRRIKVEGHSPITGTAKEN